MVICPRCGTDNVKRGPGFFTLSLSCLLVSGVAGLFGFLFPLFWAFAIFLVIMSVVFFAGTILQAVNHFRKRPNKLNWICNKCKNHFITKSYEEN